MCFQKYIFKTRCRSTFIRRTLATWLWRRVKRQKGTSFLVTNVKESSAHVSAWRDILRFTQDNSTISAKFAGMGLTKALILRFTCDLTKVSNTIVPSVRNHSSASRTWCFTCQSTPENTSLVVTNVAKATMCEQLLKSILVVIRSLRSSFHHHTHWKTSKTLLARFPQCPFFLPFRKLLRFLWHAIWARFHNVRLAFAGPEAHVLLLARPPLSFSCFVLVCLKLFLLVLTGNGTQQGREGRLRLWKVRQDFQFQMRSQPAHAVSHWQIQLLLWGM